MRLGDDALLTSQEGSYAPAASHKRPEGESQEGT